MTPDADSRLNEALAHAQFVRAVARGVLGGDSDVEDVLQETFLVAWERGPRKPGAFRAWIGTVAKRLALDRLRSGGRRRRREVVAARAEALPSVVTMAAREETRRLLLDAVLALDEPYRATLLWRYHAGLSLAEIAARQGVPVETVHTRLQRGLARLRDRLDREHPGGRAAWTVALVPWGWGREGSATPVGRAPRPRGAGVPAVATLGGIVGGLVVKKVVAVVGTVGLLALGGVLLVRAGGARTGGGSAKAPPILADVVPADGGAAPPSLAAGGRAARPSESTAAAVPAAKGSTGRLHVRALGPDGQALVGATVTLAPGVETLPSRRHMEAPGTRVGQTDASGVTLELPVGRYAIRVGAPSLRPLDLEPVEVVADRTSVREASLDQGIVVSLRVLDPATRDPVARAHVHVGGPLGCVAEGTTDGDGRCVLRGFAPPTSALQRTGDDFWSTRLYVRVFAQGFVPLDWWTECPKALGSVSYELTLRRGTSVRVRVTGADGTVPPGVGVSLVLFQNGDNPLFDREPLVVVGSDGWAVLPPLSPGEHTIRVSAGDESLRYEGVTKALEVGTTPMDVEVVLQRFAPVRLEGRVLLPDGRPARAAAVTFVAGGGESVAWSVPVDVPDGRFVTEQARVGPGALYVYVPGYLRQSFPIVVPSGSGAPLELTLKDGPRLAGRVVDRGGAPVSGLLVQAWKGITLPDGSKTTTSLGETTTGEDGRFSFVAADQTHVSLGVQSSQWLLTRLLTIDDVVLPGREVTLVVKPASEGQGLPLVLRVLDPGGAPTRERVSVQWTTDKGLRGGGSPTVLPDGRLRFAFWDPPGTYDIDVYAPGYRKMGLRAVRIEDTATPDTHDVRLDLGGVVRLRVLTSDGQPWTRHPFKAGEQLRLISSDDAGQIELTGYEPGVVPEIRVVDAEDMSGRTMAILKHVEAPGTHDAVVQRSAWASALLPWTYDEAPEGAVGELLDADGRVVDREELSRWRGGGYKRPARVALRFVAAGAYTVRVTAGALRLTGTVAVREIADVEVPLAP